VGKPIKKKGCNNKKKTMSAQGKRLVREKVVTATGIGTDQHQKKGFELI